METRKPEWYNKAKNAGLDPDKVYPVNKNICGKCKYRAAHRSILKASKHTCDYSYKVGHVKPDNSIVDGWCICFEPIDDQVNIKSLKKHTKEFSTSKGE